MRIVTFAFVWLLLSSISHAGVVIGNGIGFGATSTVEFRGAGSSAADELVVNSGFNNSDTSDSASATATLTPASSSKPKDIADLTTSITVPGPPPVSGMVSTPFDFDFSVSGTLSAEDAHNSVGSDSDAVALGDAGAFFFLDVITSGAVSLSLPAMPPLDTYETQKEIVLSVNSLPVLTQGPGSAATTYPLSAGASYELQFTYEAIVPHGVDPPIAFSYTATAVPEPSPMLWASS